ncbi:DUF7287 family protein [Archaeoglobus sp.]
MDSKGQYSLDFMISVAIFLLTVSFALYYMLSAFAPYQSTFTIQASAYRVAMILGEDAGLNITITDINKSSGTYNASIYVNWEENGTINNSVSNWYDLVNAVGSLNTTIARVGLADYYRIITFNSSYERSTPCLLNYTKVIHFFNSSWWNDTCRFNWNNSSKFGSDYYSRLDKFYRNLSVLIGLGGSRIYHFNVSLRYLNGSVCTLKGIVCEIGYPIPNTGNVAKFERLVVIDREVIGCLDGGRGDCINATTLKRLVVYVW